MVNGLPTINPAQKTTSVTGSGVDLKGYEGATIFVPVGLYTSYKHVCALYESDDDSTYTAVDDSDIIGTQPTISGASNIMYQFGYIGKKRYIKLNTTGSGSGTGILFGAFIVRGMARREPVH